MMKTYTSEELLENARRTAQSRGISMFRGLCLTYLEVLADVSLYMSDLQRSALQVASVFWDTAAGDVEQLEAAKVRVWNDLDDKNPGATIRGFEAHLSRALLGVLNPTFDEDMGEIDYCQESASFFVAMMWNWVDLSVDECLGLSGCLSYALSKGVLPRKVGAFRPRWAASLAAYELKEKVPGYIIYVDGFEINVPVDRPAERPVVFGDLSIVGTAVRCVADRFSDEEAVSKLKVRPESWVRLKGLFAVES